MLFPSKNDKELWKMKQSLLPTAAHYKPSPSLGPLSEMPQPWTLAISSYQEFCLWQRTHLYPLPQRSLFWPISICSVAVIRWMSLRVENRELEGTQTSAKDSEMTFYGNSIWLEKKGPISPRVSLSRLLTFLQLQLFHPFLANEMQSTSQDPVNNSASISCTIF